MNDIRTRIKERLQIMAECGTPYTNETNVKGKGLPVAWIMLGLAVIAILAAWKGW
jgi:hypothetical protein